MRSSVGDKSQKVRIELSTDIISEAIMSARNNLARELCKEVDSTLSSLLQDKEGDTSPNAPHLPDPLRCDHKRRVIEFMEMIYASAGYQSTQSIDDAPCSIVARIEDDSRCWDVF